MSELQITQNTPVTGKNSWLKKRLLPVTAIIIVLISMVCFRFPEVARGYLYSVFREGVRLSVIFKTRHWQVIEGEHVWVRYEPGQEENARLVLEVAESFWPPVSEKFNYDHKGKIPVLLYSSREELNASFGWPADERAMGVYWGGVVRVLSPDDWIDTQNPEEKMAIFKSSGPVVHELTHLVVDYKARGNYPRWFTEGLAQYEEYHFTGFRFSEPAGNLDQDLYSLGEMDRDFDSLPNQALAYRQSLSAVEYIIEVYGREKLHNIINDLERGNSLEQSFKNSLELEMDGFEENWHRWLASG